MACRSRSRSAPGLPRRPGRDANLHDHPRRHRSRDHRTGAPRKPRAPGRSRARGADRAAGNGTSPPTGSPGLKGCSASTGSRRTSSIRRSPAREKRVDPADRHASVRRSSKPSRSARHFALEYRALRADGRVRTLRSRGEVVVDDAGQPIRLVGIAQDITDAKLAQEALKTHLSRSAAARGRACRNWCIRQRDARAAAVRAAHATTTRDPATRSRRLDQRSDRRAALRHRRPTVKWHVKQILTKTGSSNRAEAVARVLGAPQ